VNDFRSEREQYIKNKSRANQGGDWWVIEKSERGEPQLLSFTSSSNHGNTLRHRGFKYQVMGNGSSSGAEWMAHRRKKAVDQDHGKSFNILTGMDVFTNNSKLFY
jgi:hypothetical protein